MTPELQGLLRDTSRSFYRTLQVLPRRVRSQIGLAYLLARATDTVADTGLIPVQERLDALGILHDRILGRRSEPCNFSRIAAAQPAGASSAERDLLLAVETAIGQLPLLAPADLADVRAVLEIITGGQELDLQRFGDTAGEVRALESDEALDDYTHRVAGCVGEFWTRITRRHCFPEVRLDDASFLADGIRLGRGLQLVNILRDMPRDLQAGRCYLPAPALAALGLSPAALLDPANEERVRPLHVAWRMRARDHLAAGWRYTSRIPQGQYRLRLACAWPVLLGMRTLAKLEDGGFLDPSRRIKVSRAEFKSLVIGSVLRLPFRSAWERQFSRAGG